MTLSISAEQEQALLHLAIFLMQDRSPINFNMLDYASDSEDMRILPIATIECSTVACAAGHLPFVGYAALPDEEWPEYINRITGLSMHTNTKDYYSWCFSGRWAFQDNTAYGAGQRILWLLRHELPENADTQLWGNDPLCYTNLTLERV
jgi:hypothetical protein